MPFESKAGRSSLRVSTNRLAYCYITNRRVNLSRNDPEKRATVFEKLPRLRGEKWVAVGRLDLTSSGLLIFTTSGELANRLMHPRFNVEREYAVRVMGELTPEQRAQLTSGIHLEDGTAKFDALVEQGGEGLNRWYNVVLREGRNREVRRMFEAVGLRVSRLIRVRYGIVNMPPRLRRGQLLELKATQVTQVLAWAGVTAASAADSRRAARAEGAARSIRSTIEARPRAANAGAGIEAEARSKLKRSLRPRPRKSVLEPAG